VAAKKRGKKTVRREKKRGGGLISLKDKVQGKNGGKNLRNKKTTEGGGERKRWFG